jgi:hypothetical protein
MAWPLRLSDWREISFRSSTFPDPRDADPERDPDRDGLVNFLEYAFSLDPLRGDIRGAVETSHHEEGENRFLTVSYNRRINALDIDYRVEISSDLVNWSSNGDGSGQVRTVEVGSVAQGDGIERVTVRTALPRSSEPTFMRVKVSPK